MKVKDRYWEVENSIRFANPEKTTRPLLCEPKVSEDGVRIRLWLRDLTGTGAGGAIVLLSRHEAAVMANAINTRSNWIGEKTSDMPRIGVSVTETSTIIRFMECEGTGHIALPLADGERLASCLHDMADGCWRAHCGYVPEAAVLANAIDTRRNWVGEKADDALPRIGVSATVDSTMIRFMECRGEGHIALTVTEAGRLASWLHDMADGRWRDHNGYVPEVVK